jgi:HEAT repeat protein
MDKNLNIDILKVIGDFLELGHMENIVAMFKQDKSLYGLTGDLLRDERFRVRLGTAVLFEELAEIRPGDISLAIPSLLPLLKEGNPRLRGEAATVLGIIGSTDVIVHLEKLRDDPDSQVREIITDILHREPVVPESESFSGNEDSP